MTAGGQGLGVSEVDKVGIRVVHYLLQKRHNSDFVSLVARFCCSVA